MNLSRRESSAGDIGMQRVARVVRTLRRTPPSLFISRCSSTSGPSTVSIGGVEVGVATSKFREMVPSGYIAAGGDSQETLAHLRWMLQKDVLGQDIFLIGRPGPTRRHLAWRFCELTGREAEYIAFTRDTSESDFKQRREIVQSTAKFVDQCAVTAAIEGRVLILDGVEKAERNVLPLLNNLLENREMQLEDGRFLLSAQRFDELIAERGHEQMAHLQLVRVSPDFRVIALGLPVPQFPGHPLDPPLRSRFQARDIHPPSVGAELTMLKAAVPSLDADLASRITTFAHTIRTIEAGGRHQGIPLPALPDAASCAVAALATTYPGSDLSAAMRRVYPWHWMSEDPVHDDTVNAAMKRFQLAPEEGAPMTEYTFTGLASNSDTEVASLTFQGHGQRDMQCTVQGLLGEQGAALPQGAVKYPEGVVATTVVERVVSAMVQDHAAGVDLCLVGAKGVGKSTVVNAFASSLGYSVEVLHLFNDMSARDLVQRRTTTLTGDTVWESTPLITAALEGRIAVLDGIERLAAGTLNVLQRLLQDREMVLFDGTRLVRPERWEELLAQGASATELHARQVHAIHPAFRVIAIGQPPGNKAGDVPWLTAEVAQYFRFHEVPELPADDRVGLLQDVVPACPPGAVQALCTLADQFAASEQMATLSLRQLKRLCLRAAARPDDIGALHDALADACMVRFLPPSGRLAFESIVSAAHLGVQKSTDSQTALSVPRIIQGDGALTIGDVTVPVTPPANGALVPSILFYDVPDHLHLLETMLLNLHLKEHLLLIGNQGVGKNKLADRLLQLMQRERQYIQLHRDTTVQGLTLTPSLVDGVVVWEDSPLVKAVREGHVLVVDEADKAPLEVVCVLKGLLADQEMLLSDGRRILGPAAVAVPKESDIRVHPTFQMIVLANRPGFPFLGNDFFREIGDVFAVSCVDNLDIDSEKSLLRSYAPSIGEGTLDRLTALFKDLRLMVDDGLLSYPYSTRELVNIVRHMEEYPGDSLVQTIENVFAFDSYDAGLRELVKDAFHRHGIPIGVIGTRFEASPERPSTPTSVVEQASTWRPPPLNESPPHNSGSPSPSRHALDIKITRKHK